MHRVWGWAALAVLASGCGVGAGSESSVARAAVTSSNVVAVAAFDGSSGSGTAPDTEDFDGTRSHTVDANTWIAAYHWDFGDGTSSTKGWVSHVFQSPGTYTVTLVATDNLGGTGSATLTVHVASPDGGSVDAGSSASDVVAVAAFDGSSGSGTAPDTEDFDGTRSHTTNASTWIAAYHWDFGDGTSSTKGWVSHVFQSPGTYTVTLVATDNLGATGTATLTVQVSGSSGSSGSTGTTSTSGSSGSSGSTSGSSGSTGTTRIGPVAQIVLDGTSWCGAAPFTLDVDGTRSHSQDPGGWIASYAWDFGDGSATVSGGWHSHSYANPGRYRVNLGVTDDSGLRASARLEVQVLAPGESCAPESGTVSWQDSVHVRGYGEAERIATDGAGDVLTLTYYDNASADYGGGASDSASNAEMLAVARYLPDGTLSWVRFLKATNTGSAYPVVFGFGVAGASDGRVAVAGSTDGTVLIDGLVIPAGSFLLMLAPDGHALWSVQTVNLERAVAFDSAGNVAAGGQSGSIESWDPNGAIRWSDQIVGGSTPWEIYALACDSAGNVVIGGGYGPNTIYTPAVASLRGTDGAINWGSYPVNGDGWVGSVSADSRGNIAFGGASNGTLTWGTQTFNFSGTSDFVLLANTAGAELAANGYGYSPIMGAEVALDGDTLVLGRNPYDSATSCSQGQVASYALADLNTPRWTLPLASSNACASNTNAALYGVAAQPDGHPVVLGGVVGTMGVWNTSVTDEQNRDEFVLRLWP